MSPKLSIIIPCYNCATTLREAVASCYTQNLIEDAFEIIMVDDGSTDTTKVLMEELAREHKNIHLLYHPENRGGGAAQNTGIKAAQGAYIYCLDSDNVFAPISLAPMLAYLEEHHVDGVAFFERRFFLGTNLKNYRSQFNSITDRNITLMDIFTETEPLLDNFIYTKAAYDRTAGYPEHHGFDTQCFEIRYLTAGNTVRIVPNTVFYHRQGMNELSYYERVHASGMFSVNSMLIYEEIFHLFTAPVQQELLAFPSFTDNTSSGNNVNALMRSKAARGEQFFITDYERYCTPTGRQDWFTSHESTNTESIIAKILFQLSEQQYEEAAHELHRYVATTKTIPPYLAFIELRLLQVSSGVPPTQSIKRALQLISELQITPRQYGTLGTLIRKNKIIYPVVRFVRQQLRSHE